jgi:hypothetical protein
MKSIAKPMSEQRPQIQSPSPSSTKAKPLPVNHRTAKAKGRGTGGATQAAADMLPSKSILKLDLEDHQRETNEGGPPPRDSIDDDDVATLEPDNSRAVAADGELGEGSYEGTRRYDDGVARFGADHDVERLGREAARALDGPEGPGLIDAERAAAAGPHVRARSSD